MGENISAQRLIIGPGGKGANAAVAITRTGATAVLVGCTGDDHFGHMELAHLRQEGVETDGVSVLADVATGAGIILVDAQGENTILVINGANDHLSPVAVTQALTAHQDSLDGILINFEIPEAAVAAAVHFGQEHGIPVVVDAGPPRTYAPETWAGCTVLTPNALETATLAGFPVDDDESALRAARVLLDAGPQAVALKLGARGALLVTRSEETLIPSFVVDTVDTTGAGDAFSATLTVAMAEGLALVQAVRRANAAGALAVTRHGTLPAMPSRQEIEELLARQTQD